MTFFVLICEGNWLLIKRTIYNPKKLFIFVAYD